MSTDIGRAIKDLRTNKNLTLKDLSAKINLSTGFLSQLERGLTTVDTTSLEKIAGALDTDLSFFFPAVKNNKKSILRSYEKEVFRVENSQYIHYYLTNDMESKTMLPRLVEILPINSQEETLPYQHEGEEFIYILEGILTLHLGNEEHDLYPGDSAHIDSSVGHNWSNKTNKIIRLIAVNTPNNFRKVQASNE